MNNAVSYNLIGWLWSGDIYVCLYLVVVAACTVACFPVYAFCSVIYKFIGACFHHCTYTTLDVTLPLF